MQPSILQDDVFTTLRSFLLSVLPSGVEVVQGQINRVPEPQSEDFIVMTPLFLDRLGTNVESDADVAFVGAISGATLTVSQILTGAVYEGAYLFGSTIAAGTTITAFGTGTGGVGTYSVSAPQTAASQTIQAGSIGQMQPTEWRIQMDVHGPNGTNNAQVITTLMRSPVAVDFFTASGFDMAPLYADDAKQFAFINGEQQYEDRWVINVTLEVNPSVSTPQQFFTEATVTLASVDAQFPPS